MKKFLFILFWLIGGSIMLLSPNDSFAQSIVRTWATTWGVNVWDECLMWMWKDCLVYGDLIEQVDKNKRSAKDVAQDVVMAATYFVWTLLTIVILYCWLMYILAAKSWKDPKEYEKWLTNAWIWAVLVRWAYAIVRLIQYIAKW